uniref:Uncharacterized protein n=1 Tax=Arion vulgaris TaxID=1028688 RepID=A0A0B6Y9U6_9EUPU
MLIVTLSGWLYISDVIHVHCMSQHWSGQRLFISTETKFTKNFNETVQFTCKISHQSTVIVGSMNFIHVIHRSPRFRCMLHFSSPDVLFVEPSYIKDVLFSSQVYKYVSPSFNFLHISLLNLLCPV